MADFKDKVVIVTGSSSGIGAEAAVKFAARGANVVITGRNQSGIDETLDRCKQTGARDKQILGVVGDLTSFDFITHLVQTTLTTFGDIHVLVNNAAGLRRGTFDDVTAEDLIDMYDINVVSVFNLTKAAMPHLIKTKGAIVNVSSISGSRVEKPSLAYNLSKAALDHMTKILAVEYAPKGIRVNSVNPGHIFTPIFTRQDTAGYMTPEEAEKHTATCYPLGRMGQPSEIADAILFLSSDQSSFITGVLLYVDGGRHVTIRGKM